MLIDVSKKPKRHFGLGEQLQATFRQKGFDVQVTVSGQYVHIEGIKIEATCRHIMQLLEAVGNYPKVYFEKRNYNYRVIAEADAFKYVDSRYSEK